jgi:hypothetical protein
MLYAERMRDQANQEAEEDGKVLWTSVFTRATRVGIWHAFEDVGGNQQIRHDVAAGARQALMRSERHLDYLVSSGFPPLTDLREYLLECANEVTASCVEALHDELVRAGQDRVVSRPFQDAFAERVNNVLLLDRVAFELVDGQMVPFSSRELHTAVVLPVLTLLGGRPKFAEAESAYQDALKEFANGSAADAITDAARALQGALEAAGCAGNSLGTQLASAKKMHLFGSHDYPLLEVVSKAVDWVSADRSARGDAHHAGSTTRADAWLTIHIVGALILRIADGPR